MKANARKDIIKSLGGGVLGAVGAGVMAAGTSVYGSPQATAMGAMAGASMGNAVGESAGAGLSNIGSYAAEQGKDFRYGKDVRYDGEQNPRLKNLFEGVSPSGGLKSGFETVRANYNSNKAMIQGNKLNRDEVNPEKLIPRNDVELSMSRQELANKRKLEHRAEALGIDYSNLNTEQLGAEVKATSLRNRYESRGLFEQANRSYAKETYDRNIEQPKAEVLNATKFISGDENPLQLDKTSSAIKVDSSSGFNQPFNKKPKYAYADNTSDSLMATHMKQQGINVDSNMLKHMEAQGFTTEGRRKKLDSHVQEYINNAEYLSALNDYKESSPELFNGSENSQLV